LTLLCSLRDRIQAVRRVEARGVYLPDVEVFRLTALDPEASGNLVLPRMSVLKMFLTFSCFRLAGAPSHLLLGRLRARGMDRARASAREGEGRF
jgi:hypothetical protein